MTGKARVESSCARETRKRSHIDIMANILDEADKGAKKTHIMYRCNLSHRQLQVYLGILVDRGFLASSPEKENNELSFFETTKKGQDFLDAYRSLKALMT